MPRLTDPEEIRRILLRDPVWSVYALGDLSPAMFPKTQWFGPDLALVLHDYGTSILFAMGAGGVAEALGHATRPVHLQVQQDALDAIARQALVTSEQHMWRMGWTHAERPAADARVRRLTAGDVPAVRSLYADGESTGESPDFFYDSMVADGVFHGLFEGADLVAVAGTHLVSPGEGAAAIGNVYTRRDRRGHGFGRAVTSAVLDSLAGIETIGLNVRADNAAAIHVYESLGFVRHCRFVEALAG